MFHSITYPLDSPFCLGPIVIYPHFHMLKNEKEYFVLNSGRYLRYKGHQSSTHNHSSQMHYFTESNPWPLSIPLPLLRWRYQTFIPIKTAVSMDKNMQIQFFWLVQPLTWRETGDFSDENHVGLVYHGNFSAEEWLLREYGNCKTIFSLLTFSIFLTKQT